ncbi:MAG: hypothetical protein FWE78_04170 [Methanimicrococcus sp.]|nr:hypothetical protein [Methanimicrococcus sp.]
MVKKDTKTRPPTEKPEHVNAEPVGDYHITASGKVEQTPEEKKRMYRESLLRTMVASIFGIICGGICYFTLGSAEDKFWLIILMVIVTLTYYIQRRLVFPALKMNMALLNWKDWFGIQFLVTIFCLVTWTILLNIL